jgi:hypothetical protein
VERKSIMIDLPTEKEKYQSLVDRIGKAKEFL